MFGISRPKNVKLLQIQDLGWPKVQHWNVPVSYLGMKRLRLHRQALASACGALVSEVRQLRRITFALGVLHFMVKLLGRQESHQN